MILRSCARIFNKCNQHRWNPILSHNVPVLSISNVATLHSSAKCFNENLMEFFEDTKNLGKDEIRSGRSWKLDELRIKSNSDLHKLWYILLKEKNMLLTMEHYYAEHYILFPSPERIDKVENSMKNLETVVRERNKAYYLLETGEDGERPGMFVPNAIGMKHYYKESQHVIPKYMNSWWKKNFVHHYDHEECREFFGLYYEKLRNKRTYERKTREKEVIELMKRFKNLDVEYVKELYPDINVDKLKKDDRSRGYWQL